MDWLTRFIEFLLKLFSPKPTPPPAPTGPTGATGPTPQPRRITRSDDFRTVPAITLALAATILWTKLRYGPKPSTPMRGDAP